MLKEQMKSTKVYYKIGSHEWLTYFGLPIALIFQGIFGCSFYLRDTTSIKADNFLRVGIPVLIVGILTYWWQSKRLNFKKLSLNQDLEEFKRLAREIFIEYNWQIENDNKNFMVASSQKKLFSSDMIVLKFGKKEIQWNLLEHPWTHNSGAALLGLKLEGKKVLKKIKSIA